MADVEIKNFFKLCFRNTQSLEKYIRETKPYIRPKREYYSTISEYSQNKASVSCLNNDFRFNIVFSKRYSSLYKNLNEMSPILLENMKVNQIHYGTYFKCTVIEEPFCTNCVQCLVEDENNQIEYLDLYNFCYFIDPSEIVGYLCIGTQLIIKEPYLCLKKIGTSNDFSIRCDSPTDIIVKEIKVDLIE